MTLGGIFLLLANSSRSFLKNSVDFLGDASQALLQDSAFFFQPFSVNVPWNPEGFTPEINHFAEGEGEDEVVPALLEYFFA